MKRRILVVGSAVFDRVVSVPHLPQPGETLLAHRVQTFVGGKGCNQAVAAARLGAEVRFVGAIGTDEAGRHIHETLAAEGVDASGLAADSGQPTGSASILLAPSGQNMIAVDLGTNSLVSTEMAAEAAAQPHDVLLLQGEIPLETNLNALNTSPALKIWNPAPPVEIPEEAWSKIDVLTPNEREAAALTGFPVETLDEARIAARWLHLKGVRVAVVTLGANGAYWVGESGEGHVPAPSVEAVDTVGAGDSLNGALAVALAAPGALDHFEQALNFAVQCASISVQRVGAQSGLPRPQDLPEELHAHLS
jgi:ribokinase